MKPISGRPGPGASPNPNHEPASHDGPTWMPDPATWTSGASDLLRRIAETGIQPGASPLDQMWPALGAPPPSRLVATLQSLQDGYLTARGLHGALHFETDMPEMEAPAAPLRSLLEHLVEGALRDNPAALPYCHVGRGAEDADHVTLYVRDNGLHLPECSIEDLREFIRNEKVSKVPDRVYRLLLADTLVQWLGGSLAVGATAGDRGTTILVRLPRHRATSPVPPASSPYLARHVF